MSVWDWVWVCWVNVAVTVAADVRHTHEPVPVLRRSTRESARRRHGRQPRVPAAGAEQVVPHVMPAGELPMLHRRSRPCDREDRRRYIERGGHGRCGGHVYRQVPVPVHLATTQPAKVEPDAGVAVRVTAVPLP
jgi:hypothetical protein